MADKKIQGQFGILYKWDADEGTTGAYVPLICMTTNTFNRSMDITTDDPTKCNPDNTEKSAGINDYSVTGSAQIVDMEGATDRQSFFELKKVFDAREKANYKYDYNADGANADTYVEYFEAFITDLPATQEVNVKSTFDITLEITGGVSDVDPLV